MVVDNNYKKFNQLGWLIDKIFALLDSHLRFSVPSNFIFRLLQKFGVQSIKTPKYTRYYQTISCDDCMMYCIS
jgi:hypothetical protein